MNKNTGFHKAALPIAAALILILVASGPAAFGGFEEPISLVSQTISGNHVIVKIANSSNDPVSGDVWVEATVDGEVVLGIASVTVLGKQVATVAVGFPSDVDQIISSGLILDDGGDPY